MTEHHIHINNNLLRITTLPILADTRRGAERTYTLQLTDTDTLQVHVYRDPSENRAAARVVADRLRLEQSRSGRPLVPKKPKSTRTAKRRRARKRKPDEPKELLGGIIKVEPY